MNKLEHYHEVINQKQLIIFHLMFLYMTCNIHCEEILSSEIVDFIKTFHLFFRWKGVEGIFESYPQMILNVFIMQSLQIDEWLNIGSCVISALSVILGFSDFLAMELHDYIEVADIPFTKKLFAMLSISIDTFLRALSIAYLMTFMKTYILLLPLFYFVLMLIIVCIKKKSSECKHFLLIVLYTILSFGCSAWEGTRDKNGHDFELKQKFKLRPISKAVFTTVLIGFSIYFGVTIAPGLLSNDLTNTDLTFNNTSFNDSACENLCPNSDQNQTEIEDYCSGLQYHISPNIHIGMWIAIGVLFCLSWVEFALEACGDWMPYRQLLKPVFDETRNDPELQDVELQLLAQTEGKARLETEVKTLANEKARLEAEVKALAEEIERLEAEAKGKVIAEEKARLEAEEKATFEAEAAETKARLEVEE